MTFVLRAFALSGGVWVVGSFETQQAAQAAIDQLQRSEHWAPDVPAPERTAERRERDEKGGEQ
jgi:hypothetical protein